MFKNINIKRIIAREGLIIIFLLFLAVISAGLGIWINKQENIYKDNVQEIELTISDNNERNRDPFASKSIKEWDNVTPVDITKFKTTFMSSTTDKWYDLADLSKYFFKNKMWYERKNSEEGPWNKYQSPNVFNQFDEGKPITDPETLEKLESGTGVILQFPKNISEDVIRQTIKRGFPKIKADGWITWDFPRHKIISGNYNAIGERISTSIVYKINFSYFYLFFLFFAYPLYLLLRFIIWAIGTLGKSR